MRWRDLSGENELSGAISLMCCLIVANEAGWKILGSSRRVIRRVLEGGDGCESGGREDKSSDKGECDRFRDRDTGEDPVEVGGELDVIFCV